MGMGTNMWDIAVDCGSLVAAWMHKSVVAIQKC
jgi:hypothetical protein